MNNEFIDLINILSFVLQVQNYNENLSQNDKADLMNAIDEKTHNILERIELDLKEQNKMLEEILERLRTKDGY